MQERARRGFLAALVGIGLITGLPGSAASEGDAAAAQEEPAPDPAQVKADKLARVRARIERARKARTAPDAEPEGEQPPASASESGSWSERLAAAADRIVSTKQRLTNANAAYARARHDRDARGDDLKAIKDERVAARDEYWAARRALPKLVEQARVAGVEASVLRPYED